jgi:hypothetical protein
MHKVFAILFLFVGLVGCGVRKPMVQFKNATIMQSTPEAFSLEVAFEIFNTNDEPLKLLMYDYSVSANGSTVYTGLSSAEQTVPRWSSVVNSIPVVIRKEAVVGLDQIAWTLHGTLGYIPPKALAETMRDTGIWEPTASVRAHGRVQVPEIDD